MSVELAALKPLQTWRYAFLVLGAFAAGFQTYVAIRYFIIYVDMENRHSRAERQVASIAMTVSLTFVIIMAVTLVGGAVRIYDSDPFNWRDVTSPIIYLLVLAVGRRSLRYESLWRPDKNGKE